MNRRPHPAVLDRIGRRSRPWREIAAMLPLAGPGTVGACVLLNLVLGALPLVFIVGMSVLLSRLPQAVAAAGRGADGWGPVAPALAVSAVAFVLQQLLTPLRTALGETVTRRVDGACVSRMMSAALDEAPVQALEDQETLNQLQDARDTFLRQALTPGEAAAGLLGLVSRYTQLLGACALIGYALGVPAGLLAAATALVMRFGQRGSLGRFAKLWSGMLGLRRQMAYLRRIGSGAEAAKEIRVLGLIDWATARHGIESRGYLTRLWAGRRRLLFLPFVVLSLVGFLGILATLLLLSRAAGHGHLTLLQLAISVQSALIPARFGVYFPECDVQTQYGMNAMRALTEFETRARRIDGPAPRRALDQAARPAADPPPPAGLKSAIRFERVGFRYTADGPWVLRDLDLVIEAGRSTAIVGLNGAGKTTLVKLLAGLYRPTEGRITADGADLADRSYPAWQRNLAAIFQDFIRYELSFDQNVAIGVPEAVRGNAPPAAATARAGADEVRAALPSGGATVLSSSYPGGVDLSGGQWQRVALARVFHAVDHGASVLILDEPTAALDVRAEADFFDRVLDLSAGLTSVMISHRFSTVRRADHIVVLENGAVAQQGPHEALLAAEGRYAELFRLQAQRFEAAGAASGADNLEGES